MTSSNARIITNDALFAVPMIRRKLLHIDRIQKRYQLSLSHVQILMLLSHNEPVSISLISEGLGISKPNVTPLVDRLCMRGFVSRDRCENDRRIVNVTLTESGKAMLNDIADDISVQMEQWLSSLSAERAEGLKNALRQLADILADDKPEEPLS